MSKDTNIKWTESTWNPITGCSKISAGCKNCYALRDWDKLAKKENSVYFGRKFTDIAFHNERLDQPIRWKKPKKIFVNSMSDLFHEDLDFDTIDKIFMSMIVANWHTYQVLTKRPDIMVNYLNERMPLIKDKMKNLDNYFSPDQFKLNPELRKFNVESIEIPFSHIWLGTSIEDTKAAETRLPLLKEIKKYSKVAWISAEPLVESYSIAEFKNDIDWFVLGGESGPKARIMEESWVKHFIAECESFNIPILFKQWGEYAPVNGVMTLLGVDIAGDLVDGVNYAQYPNLNITSLFHNSI
jgi:protein gp37